MKKRSKKVQIAVNLLIILLSLGLILVTYDLPSPTAEIALHRMEAAQLLGPTEIIATEHFQDSGYDHMMIGKSDYGYTTFEWSDSAGWDNGSLSYYPKEEDITLFCTYYTYGGLVPNGTWLPIFAFTDHSAAVRAQMRISIENSTDSETYLLDAQRSDGGYFLFALDTNELKAEFFWLLQQAICRNYNNHVLSGTVDITVELFSTNGSLLDTVQYSVSLS